MRDPVAFVWGFAAFTGIIVGFAVGLRWLFRRLNTEAPAAELGPASVPPPVEVAEPARCCCGELATRPVSRTRAKVTWADDLRARWGMPISYEQFIPSDAPQSLCDLHGRVWDAKLRRRRATVIASKRTECDEAIAIEMAAIEGEVLMRELFDSMTEDQRRKARRGPAPVRVLAKTGTDDSGTVRMGD